MAAAILLEPDIGAEIMVFRIRRFQYRDDLMLPEQLVITAP